MSTEEAFAVFEQFFGSKPQGPATSFSPADGIHVVISSSQQRTSQQLAPPRPQPPAPPVQAARPVQKARCLASGGVAYRRSMRLEDRMELPRGPNEGDVVAVLERRGDWVRDARGWLPVRLNGRPVLEVLVGAPSIRCLARDGVAYRRTPHEGDRLEAPRGPGKGDVVPVDELWGSWAATAAGWLPLHVNGAPVFEVLQPDTPAAAPDAGGRFNLPFPIAVIRTLPRLSLTLVSGFCLTLYAGAIAARRVFGLWFWGPFGWWTRGPR